MEDSPILTIGYIGNGKSTNRYHLPYVLERKDKIKVKKIYEHSDTRKWTPVESVDYTQEIDDILTDPEIQVVVICTPPHTHYELAKKALEHGKHVVVEKPIALHLNEALDLYDYAGRNNLILQCYQNRRFDSDYLTLKKVLDSNKLGKIFEVEMNYDYFRPEVPESMERFTREDAFVFTHASHTLDQAIALFGQPIQIRHNTAQLLGYGRMNDYFDFDLFYDGMKVSIRSSYFRIKPRPRLVVYGRNGMFEKETGDQQEADLKKFYMPSNPDFGMDTPEQYGQIIYYDRNGNYHNEKVITEKGDYGQFYDELYDTIINSQKPLVKKQETLKVMEIIEEAVENLS